MSDKTVHIQVVGLTTGTFLVFLTLKLLGKIGWSWWWVTAPLWGPPVLALAVAAVAIILVTFFCTVVAILSRIFE